jgi:hypothetical protein
MFEAMNNATMTEANRPTIGQRKAIIAQRPISTRIAGPRKTRAASETLS